MLNNIMTSEITIQMVLFISFLHFVADFLFQTDWMALNKSSSNVPLGVHTLVYSVPFITIGTEYLLLNGALHFCVDFVTSRITKRLFAKQKIGLAFKVIGFDQFLHFCCLYLTLGLAR